MQQNVTIFGIRGSGKSAGLLVMLLEMMFLKEVAIVLIDRPGTAARQMVGYATANGMEKRVIFEQASKTDRVLSWPFIRPSQAEDPLQRQRENELEDERVSLAFYAKRNLKSGEDRPWTKEYLDAAIAVYRSQPTPLALYRILDCFRPGTPGHKEMMDNAAERAAVAVFQRIEALRMRNPVQYRNETGAAERFLKICSSPVIWTRHGEGINWTEAIAAKSLIAFDLSDTTAEAARSLGIFVTNAVITACRNRRCGS